MAAPTMAPHGTVAAIPRIPNAASSTQLRRLEGPTPSKRRLPSTRVTPTSRKVVRVVEMVFPVR